MLPFTLTLKPFAASAWAYSEPRMYSSVKFLSPIVTAGFQTPGPRDADRGAEHPRQVVARLVVDDVPKAPAVTGQRADRRRRDDKQRGGADAGEDQRDPERQLDLAQDLPAAHPHPAGCVDEIGVHP